MLINFSESGIYEKLIIYVHVEQLNDYMRRVVSLSCRVELVMAEKIPFSVLFDFLI